MEEVPTPKPQSGEAPARFRANGVCYYSAEQSGKAKEPLSLALSGVTRIGAIVVCNRRNVRG